jgi:hypothetical protein
VYSYDTLHEISLLMATDRNRLPADGPSVPKGSYEQVVCCLRCRVVGFDQCGCIEDGYGWIRSNPAASASGGDSTASAAGTCGDSTTATAGNSSKGLIARLSVADP